MVCVSYIAFYPLFCLIIEMLSTNESSVDVTADRSLDFSTVNCKKRKNYQLLSLENYGETQFTTEAWYRIEEHYGNIRELLKLLKAYTEIGKYLGFEKMVILEINNCSHLLLKV